MLGVVGIGTLSVRRLLVFATTAAAPGACGLSGSSNLSDIPSSLDPVSCPFDAGTGNGVLASSATRAAIGACDSDQAECTIDAEERCPDGTVIGSQWSCVCRHAQWQCQIAGRSPWGCRPIDAGPR